MAEVRAQLDLARRRGLSVDYIDDHMGYEWVGDVGERIARLWGSPIDREKAYTPKERLLRRIKNVCFLDGYDLTEAAMAAYAKRLREFRPQLLIAFTTCLNILAEYMEPEARFKELQIHLSRRVKAIQISVGRSIVRGGKLQVLTNPIECTGV